MSIAQQDTPTTTPPIDMIDQVGRMLSELADNRFAVPKLAHAADVADTPNEREDALRADSVVALASAVLAVAGEVREVRNAVVDIAEMLRRLAAALEV